MDRAYAADRPPRSEIGTRPYDRQFLHIAAFLAFLACTFAIALGLYELTEYGGSGEALAARTVRNAPLSATYRFQPDGRVFWSSEERGKLTLRTASTNRHSPKRLWDTEHGGRLLGVSDGVALMGSSYADLSGFMKVRYVSRYHGVDLRNGRTLWSRALDDREPGGALAKGTAVVTGLGDNVTGLNAQTGTTVWRNDLRVPHTQEDLWATDGGSAYGILELGRQGAHAIWALVDMDLASGRTKGTRAFERGTRATQVMTGDGYVAYVEEAWGSDSSKLLVMEDSTGRMLWSAEGWKPLGLSSGFIVVGIPDSKTGGKTARELRVYDLDRNVATFSKQLGPRKSSYPGIGLRGDGTWGDVWVSGTGTDRAPVVMVAEDPGGGPFMLRSDGWTQVSGYSAKDGSRLFSRMLDGPVNGAWVSGRYLWLLGPESPRGHTGRLVYYELKRHEGGSS